jgi:hypothetical protein
VPLGKESLAKLDTCHPVMRELIIAVANGIDQGDLAYAGIHDITVLCGWRGEAAQNQAVADGASQTPWPRSAHNVIVNGKPRSNAADVAVYPVEWTKPDYTRKMETLHAYVAGVAHGNDIDLYDISWDRPHIQLNVP